MGCCCERCCEVSRACPRIASPRPCVECAIFETSCGSEGLVTIMPSYLIRIALVPGNTASSKKSHMENMLKRLVSQHPEIQNKNIPKVSRGNGTIKCVRTALEKVNYTIITSSEPLHTIRTPYLEDPDGSQPLPRTMINTWTQGEDDESGTGRGMTHLKSY